jgi:GTPase
MSPKGPPPPQPESSPVVRAGTVALVGRSNVGKSTLMNALLGEALAIVSPIPQTTRNRVLGVLRHGDTQVGLLDTPGLHKPRSHLGKLMNAAARSAVDEADVVLFVTSAEPRRDGPLRVSKGDRTLLADIGKGKPTVLVINKIDLVKPRSLMLSLIEEMATIRDFASVVPISARRDDGLGLLLDEIAPLLPKGNALWGSDDLTDRPVRFFVSEFVREEILRVAREELPYVVAVTVESFDESHTIPRIDATIHVEREGQKPMILGQGGSRLRDIGIGARERTEALLGHRVHLQLFVRVTPGWTEDARLLSEFGYDEGGQGQRRGDERIQIDLADPGGDDEYPEADEIDGGASGGSAGAGGAAAAADDADGDAVEGEAGRPGAGGRRPLPPRNTRARVKVNHATTRSKQPQGRAGAQQAAGPGGKKEDAGGKRRDDRAQGARPRDDRPQGARPRDDRAQGARPRDDRAQGARPRDEQGRHQRPGDGARGAAQEGRGEPRAAQPTPQRGPERPAQGRAPQGRARLGRPVEGGSRSEQPTGGAPRDSRPADQRTADQRAGGREEQGRSAGKKKKKFGKARPGKEKPRRDEAGQQKTSPREQARQGGPGRGERPAGRGQRKPKATP